MCAFARACLALAYRFASCQKFRHLDHPSKFMASKTFAFWKTERRLKFPQILDFENLDFFIGGARLSLFSWSDTFLKFILFNVDLWCLKNLATTNFLTFCIFIESPWVFVNLCTWKQAKFWVLDFPKICSNFAFVWGFVLGFVSFARFTEKRF